jgi:hypothetical protein
MPDGCNPGSEGHYHCMAHHRMCARGEMLVVFSHAGAHASLLCLSKLSTQSNMSSQRPVEQCFEQFAQLAYYAVVQPPETDSEHAGPLVFVIHTCSSQNCYHIFSLTLPHCTALHITYLSECCSHSNQVSVYRPHRSLTVDPHTDPHPTQAVILTNFTALTHHDTLIPYSVHSPLQADHCNLTADISTHALYLRATTAAATSSSSASCQPGRGRLCPQHWQQQQQ